MMITSFVPAIHRRTYLSNPHRDQEDFVLDQHATTLWIDICNFSPLCNRLMQDPASGVENISSILSRHYNHILEITNTYGAEPLFFAGDGLLVGWTGSEQKAFASVGQAASCAHELINRRNTQDDRGDVLSYHLVVSTGALHLTEIGGVEGGKMLSFYGQVFTSFIRASKNRAPDQVIITDEAILHLPADARKQPLPFKASILLDNLNVVPVPAVAVGAADEETIENLKAFAPRTINFPISEERLKWISEVRPVSALFVKSPVQVTDGKSQLDRLKALGAVAVPYVRKYDGLINQIWIDEKDANLYICFGPAPSAHVDNPYRCVRLALDLQKEFASANMEVSLGICTGLGYCGVIGNSTFRQFTVLGDVVNLSARLAGVSQSGIFCDERTYHATFKLIDYAKPTHISIKGQPMLVTTYQALALKAETQLGKDKARAIGRDKELEALHVAFERARTGDGAIITLEGKQGIGKSRVLRTFKAALEDEGFRVITALGDYIERKRPYSLWSDVFVSILNLEGVISLNDSAELLNALPESYRPKAALLNSVLNTDLPESEVTGLMTGGQKVRETSAFLLEILIDAAIDPFVIIFDDAQWIDENGWALLHSLSEAHAGCLIILAMGEGENDDLMEKIRSSATDTLILEPLLKADQDNLICETLGVEEISDEISTLIRQVTKGNPFFNIELISALRDQNLLIFEGQKCVLKEGAVIDDSSMPETVRGALRRKIDRLDPGSRLSIKVGSVVGLRFAEEIVKSIYPIEIERSAVPEYLDQVEKSGLINEAAVDNLGGFAFNNAITAEVAYQMTLAEQRRQLHKEIAEWYEKNFRENLPPFFVRLAYHWREAGEIDNSVHYHEQEAIRLFGQGFAKNSLDVGLRGVELFGLKVERTPETIMPRIQEHMASIQAFMAERTIPSLIDHKPLEEPKTDRLIKLLLELTPYAHQSHQAELFALMAIITLRRTLDEGNGESAAEVFAMFAIIHKTFTGDSTGAYSWSKLALAVDERKLYTRFSRAGFIHCWFIAPWIDPLRSLIPIANQAIDLSFEKGDFVYGCFNLSLSTILIAVSGRPLDEVIESATSGFLRNPNLFVNAAFHLIHEEQVAKALQGKTDGYTSLTDHKYEEGKDIANILDTDLVNQIGYYLISKLQLNVHFGNWKEAVNWGDQAWPLLPGFANQPGHIRLEQFYTMAALYHVAELEGAAADKYATAASEGIERMSSYSITCPDNFEHKFLLLKAIDLGLKGQIDQATEAFIKSAEKAHAQQFVHDAGLAHEHLARMLQNNGHEFVDAATAAIKDYTIWGATAKVTYIGQLFGILAPE